MAKKETKRKNVRFICCSVEKIPFQQILVDVVISIWGALNVVKDLRKKVKILKEVERLVKSGGDIYIIRDNHIGEWVKIKRH